MEAGVTALRTPVVASITEVASNECIPMKWKALTPG